MDRYETHPHVEAGLKYCADVLSGEVPACKWTKAACQRQLDDLAKWNAPDSTYHFDRDEAERVCLFVENLPHVKGEWARRKETIRLEPWQCFILTTLFGWRKPDGFRRFSTAYNELARKNAKSAMAAGVGLYMLVADGEAGAEVYSLATTREQASLVFSTARQMALKEREFREAYGVEVNAKTITVPDEDGKFLAQSSEDNSLDGLNVHCGIIDELHAHKTRGVWDVIETATGARKQSLIFAITTAGSNRAGICYEQRSYVCKILNCTLKAHDGLGYRVDGESKPDENYFGIIYTLDDGPHTELVAGELVTIPADDWTTEIAWKKANPNYGVSVNPDDLKRKCRKAMNTASAQPNFLTKHLDVWVNADSSWMDMRAWDRCADREMKPEDFKGWRAVMGLDLASKIDVCSMALLLKKDAQYRLFTKHYLPEDAIDDSNNSQYRGWADEKHLVETGDATTDYAVIETDLKAWVSAFGVYPVAFDPGFAWDFSQRMSNDGQPMVEYGATVLNYSEPMKLLEALVLEGAKGPVVGPDGQTHDAATFRHDGNPMMTWMISNVVCHRDAKDNVYPRKERPENKIDGAVAAIAALGIEMRSPEAPEPKVLFI
jgi:phage terminase large subunit-like protein